MSSLIWETRKFRKEYNYLNKTSENTIFLSLD